MSYQFVKKNKHSIKMFTRWWYCLRIHVFFYEDPKRGKRSGINLDRRTFFGLDNSCKTSFASSNFSGQTFVHLHQQGWSETFEKTFRNFVIILVILHYIRRWGAWVRFDIFLVGSTTEHSTSRSLRSTVAVNSTETSPTPRFNSSLPGMKKYWHDNFVVVTETFVKFSHR